MDLAPAPNSSVLALLSPYEKAQQRQKAAADKLARMRREKMIQEMAHHRSPKINDA
eukprot:CAMPEP_0182485752 /NCGR_PEP_ID=MMETSP1319-20130603/45788_1 /TAXON_ID=172717 /ORGANISM="Bolidomonas pacifica, Strain RCC208" /LENGTH=55 /DNA_ID=CAMNT_0024687781 /DNA_START=90 /DNA_END=253 /DNA_ORIENTATION=+